MSNSPIRGVLLDIDGTLYRQPPLRVRMVLELFKYTIRQPFRGLHTAYLLRGFRANRESLRLRTKFQGSLEEIQYSSFATRMKVPIELVQEIVEEWIMIRPLRFLRLYRRPGIEDFLKLCRDNRIKVGALSDYPTREKVKALGLGHWFNLHLCSTDPEINKFKPSPEGILLACKTWKLVPEELLYVGDQVKIDGAAAEAAGARFALVGHSQDCRHFAVRDFFELAGCPQNIFRTKQERIMNVRAHLANKKSMNIRAYIAIARPDHWFKNIFMLFGLILALFLEPSLVRGEWYLIFLIAVAATCLVASSNYVINEVLDAPKDRLHPTKRYRPVPSGKIAIPLAYAEWFILASSGLYLAYWINTTFFVSALALLVSGFLYNVPPIRTKDIPYLDVLSESINNPIRLFLGWFALIPDRIPPISLIISYWMAGAFFMGAKRFAELRMINNPEVAGQYRASFKHYNLDTLIISQFFYVTACSVFFGIFIIRYHLELILVAPFLAGFFSYYVKLSLKPNSSVQTPEKLYKEYGFVAYACALLAIFVLLLFTHIEFLYDIFNVVPYKLSPLWTF